MTELARLPIDREDDVFTARRLVRDAAAALGFDTADQLRFAIAVSEWSRVVVAGAAQSLLQVSVVDNRGGLLVAALHTAGLDVRSASAGDTGLQAVRGLLDVEIADADGDPAVLLSKPLPTGLGRPDPLALERVRAQLSLPASSSRLEDLQAHNAELLRVFEEAQARRRELAAVSAELEQTDRGVIALHTELTTDAPAEAVEPAVEPVVSPAPTAAAP